MMVSVTLSGTYKFRAVRADTVLIGVAEPSYNPIGEPVFHETMPLTVHPPIHRFALKNGRS